MKLEKLLNSFLELEKEHNLLHQQWAGIKVWQAYRYQIFNDIVKKKGVFKIAHTKKNSTWSYISNVTGIIKSSFLHNPYLSKNKPEYICIDHTRKKKVDGKYIDIYTNYFLNELSEKGKNFEVWEKPYHNKHLTEQSSNRFHLDAISILHNAASLFYQCKFSKEERDRLTKIEESIKSQFSVEIDLQKKFKKYVKISKSQYSVYKKLLQFKNPKKLFVVVSYGRSNIIKAARDLGIETIELQHGLISRMHLGYHYPNNKFKGNLEYFPDKLFLWSDYWKNKADFPIIKSKLSIYPFIYLEKKIDLYKSVDKIDNQILVISQGAIGDKMAEQLFKNIASLKNFRILFKLHPGEIDRWNTYENLNKLKKFKNVKIIDDFNEDIYFLLAQSKYVIGVYSTSVFEAIEFNCKILLLDLPGIEYMKDLIVNDRAKLICNNTSILDTLN